MQENINEVAQAKRRKEDSFIKPHTACGVGNNLIRCSVNRGGNHFTS